MIELGDVVDVLKKYDDDTFSGCFCDPPYGLNFMGKTWDGAVPDVSVWSEVYRTMKSGSYILAFGGTRTWHRLAVAIEDAGFNIRDTIMWVYGTGFPKGHNIGKSVGEIDWNGYGTALKPAYEPVIMAMKPVDKTYAHNAEKHGLAGINIDASRVGNEVMSYDGFNANHPYPSTRFADRSTYTPIDPKDMNREVTGRYPANLVHDGSDEVVKNFPDRKTTYVTKDHKNNRSTKSAVGNLGHPGQQGYDDDGSASRFFYVPKPSQKERNEGFGKNTHPTVKPIALCEYLAKMILPPNEHKLLVPFSGSGSEVIGALNVGWKDVTGIEISEEFVEIAKARIEYHCGSKGLEKFFV